ncbi:hypothetical protein [Bradyrhizobium sp. ISRA463]|uniref:hypothetical protein n=1 Tax=Bradyrhizobium sp. ISRA463 TaxID=2866199 RepID=UPI0032B05F68
MLILKSPNQPPEGFARFLSPITQSTLINITTGDGPFMKVDERSGIVGIYQNYKYQAEMREAVDKYEWFIKRLLASKPTQNVAAAPPLEDTCIKTIVRERSESADTLVACL